MTNPSNSLANPTNSLERVLKSSEQKRIKCSTDKSQPLTFTFVEGVDKTAKFDLCSMITCVGRQVDYQRLERYICLTTNNYLSPLGHGITYSLQYDKWCQSWDNVIASTGTYDWGYYPKHNLKSRLSIIKGSIVAPCQNNECNPLYLTLLKPSPNDTGLYVLGSCQSGKDPLGHFQINVTKNATMSTSPTTASPGADFQVGPRVTYLRNVTYESKLALETEYADKNLWLEWMRYTAIQTDRTDCVACAKARPVLGTALFRLNNQNDPDGLHCTIQLFKPNVTETACKTLSLLYPPVVYLDAPPSVIVYAGNYMCFSRSGQGVNVGPLPSGYCTETINITSDTGNYTAAAFENHNTSRADLWWLCGDKKLRPHLPSKWAGECALTQLLMQFHMIPFGAAGLHTRLPHSPCHRSKRDTPGGSFNSKVYIDAIGVPRGVPDEFKARNQIAAGFESLFYWITVNKNVDWINYIHYNQQRTLIDWTI